MYECVSGPNIISYLSEISASMKKDKPVFHFTRIVAKRSVFQSHVNTNVELNTLRYNIVEVENGRVISIRKCLVLVRSLLTLHIN